jgi:hypothetical protein
MPEREAVEDAKSVGAIRKRYRFDEESRAGRDLAGVDAAEHLY